MIDRRIAIVLGMLAVLAGTSLWSGLGTAGAFADNIERTARRTLDHYEMTEVQARLERGPLTRRLILSGPADDFQRSELVRIMDGIPGVADARWAADASRGGSLPLIVEAMLYSLVGFGLGLLAAYLAELRRRANAEWRW